MDSNLAKMQKDSCSSWFQFPYNFTGEFGNNVLRTVSLLGEKIPSSCFARRFSATPGASPFLQASEQLCVPSVLRDFHFTTPSETESTFCLRQSCSSAMSIINDASQTCIPGFQSDSEVLPHLSLEWLKVTKRQCGHRESHTVLMSIAWIAN